MTRIMDEADKNDEYIGDHPPQDVKEGECPLAEPTVITNDNY